MLFFNILISLLRLSLGFNYKQALYREQNDVVTSSLTDKLECAVQCENMDNCEGFSFNTDRTCHFFYGSLDDEPCAALLPDQCHRRFPMLTVTNGLAVGEFAPMQYCGSGSYAGGMKVRESEWQGPGWQDPGTDDTAINAMTLHCLNETTLQHTTNITSNDGVAGEWITPQTCPTDYWIVSFKLQVEGLFADYAVDDTGVNRINVLCRGPGLAGTDTVELTSGSQDWGSYGAWSATCPSGQAVCGLSSRSHEFQGLQGDDLGLTDVRMFCC